MYEPRNKRRTWPAIEATDPFSECAKRALMLLYREAEIRRDANGDRTWENSQLGDITVTMLWQPHYQDGPVVHIRRQDPPNLVRVLSFDLHRIIDYNQKEPMEVVRALEKFQRYAILQELADV